MKQRKPMDPAAPEREERVGMPMPIHPDDDGALMIDELEHRLTPEEWPPLPWRQVGWGC
jgi:hypothetical protein